MAIKILFMGTPDFAVPALEAIIDEGFEVVAVVTQPDRPKGRGRSVRQSPVKAVALAHGIEVLQPVKIKESAFIEKLNALAPDYTVVIAYGRILPLSVLEIAGNGSINVHASLLPRWRGAAPINYAITAGDTVTGVTTMLMDTGMDTGDILLKRKVEIGDGETAGELFKRLSALGAKLLIETIKGMEAGSVTPKAQNGDEATYAPTLKKSDGRLDWNRSAQEIANLVRGFSPWPGTYTEYNGKLLKIHAGRVGKAVRHADAALENRSIDIENVAPGTVISTSEGVVGVKCGAGIYEITELQPQDRRRMAAEDFLSGYRVGVGERFGADTGGGVTDGTSV